MISSEWLTSFLAFAEDMSFTHAAARLHISQPALHVQIRKLGESLDVALYVRHGRALVLTDAGRKLLSFARDQRELTARMLEELTGTAREASVVLAAGEGTFLNLLGPALLRFQQGKNGQLRVLTRDRDQAIEAVRLGEAHLAVTAVDEAPDGFVARRVAKVGAAVVLPQGHRLARKRQLTLHDLRDEPIIAPAAGRPLRAALARAWADVDKAWKPAVEANGWELMMHFAALGMGVAIVNDFCSPPRGAIRRPLRGMPSVQYQLLRRRHRLENPAVAALEAAILSGAVKSAVSK